MQDKKTILRQKWAEALESGEYKQYCGAMLGPDGSRCAWGVGLEVGRRYFNMDSLITFSVAVGIPTEPIAFDNDYSMTFEQIAQKIRNGGYDGTKT